MSFKKGYFLAAVVTVLIFSSCKKWDDADISNPNLSINLFDAISGDASLSIFSGYIKQTGADILLQSSKGFTVWAPNNNALQSLDPSIISDTAKLRMFVLNHISTQPFFTRDVQNSIRVPMLSGKYNNFFSTRIEDANIIFSDKFVSNGVLHVIDKPVPVLPSLWEFVTSSTSQYSQNNFIAGLNFTTFVPSLAIVDSIIKATGQPSYRPGTGFVQRNFFNDRVFDLKREDKQYTYFVIANAGFTAQTNALKPYYQSSSAATTDSLTMWNVVKDLVIDTLFPTAASLPATFVSKSGVVVPTDKSLIIETRKVSNGIVYVLSSSSLNTAAKFKEIRIEGEKPTGFQSDKTSNTNFLRLRKDRPDTTKTYSDLMVSGHGVTDFYAFYRLSEMPSMKYNVYARAINDFQTQLVYQSLNPGYFTAPSTFTQIPSVPVYAPTTPRTPQQLWYPVSGIRGGVTPVPPMYTFTPPGFLPVPINSPDPAFNEVFLGSFTSTSYGTLEIRLMSGPTATLPALPTFGATGNGPIVLDYFRLVPVP